jgi:hypothetical protein
MNRLLRGPFTLPLFLLGRGEGNLDKMKRNVYAYENIFIFPLTYNEYRTF